MHKYDWSNVPAEVNWMATDQDGWAYGFVSQPKPRESYGFWSPVEFVVSIPKESNPFKGDWKESLEQRPKGASHD
ncbi:hypothetical protein ABBZ21_14880 [Acinetobacter baumannii]|uniref:hypothetical protein n=1 Tax=Acinetobacter baumannii TaxID=470 RepID=UPI00385B3DC8